MGDGDTGLGLGILVGCNSPTNTLIQVFMIVQ